MFHILLIQTYHAYMGKVRPHMARAGLSNGQPKILRYLRDHGSCPQRELAEFYHIEPATVSRLLDGIEEQGLITRTVSPASRRTTLVEITPTGSGCFEQFEEGRKLAEADAFCGFTPQQREEFLTLLELIHANVSDTKDDGAKKEDTRR